MLKGKIVVPKKGITATSNTTAIIYFQSESQSSLPGRDTPYNVWSTQKRSLSTEDNKGAGISLGEGWKRATKAALQHFGGYFKILWANALTE